MFTFYGNGLVWDKDKKKVLCKFNDGILKTSDSYIIGKLKELNYEFNEAKKTNKK